MREDFAVHIKLHLLALLKENDKPLLDSKLKGKSFTGLMVPGVHVFYYNHRRIALPLACYGVTFNPNRVGNYEL